MRYTIYEDPVTHRFAFLPLPNRFADGDEMPICAIDQWFASHAEAVAALPELLNREENQPTIVDDAAPLPEGRTLATRHH